MRLISLVVLLGVAAAVAESHKGHHLPHGVRGTFLATLKRKGVEGGTAEVVAYALGDDEIDNLPPAMVGHLIAQLLHIEAVFKKAQMALAQLDSSASFLVSSALPLQQAKVATAVNTLLLPVGVLYGNDAIVKRIGQALNIYFSRQLADPYPWTYAIMPNEDHQAVPTITQTSPESYNHVLQLRDTNFPDLIITQPPTFEGLGFLQ